MPTRNLIQDVSTGDVIYPFSGSNLQNTSVPNSALQTDVTLQGNTFNDANELVQLESDGKLPALDGSNLTGVTATIPSDVAVTNADNEFSANQTFNAAISIEQLNFDVPIADPTQDGNWHIYRSSVANTIALLAPTTGNNGIQATNAWFSSIQTQNNKQCFYAQNLNTSGKAGMDCYDSVGNFQTTYTFNNLTTNSEIQYSSNALTIKNGLGQGLTLDANANVDSTNPITVSNEFADYRWNTLGAATDEGKWRFLSNSTFNQLELLASNDALTSAAPAMIATRGSGATVANVTFPTDVIVKSPSTTTDGVLSVQGENSSGQTRLELHDASGNFIGGLLVFNGFTFNGVLIQTASGLPITFYPGSTVTGQALSNGHWLIGEGITDDGANVLQVGGDVAISNIGSTLKIKSGTNAKAGTFTLASGSATVANTSVTANSVIHVTLKTASGARAVEPLITPTAGTGFTAAGTATDNGVYNYVILEVN